MLNSVTGKVATGSSQSMEIALTGAVSDLALSRDGMTLAWTAGNVLSANPNFIPLGKFISIGHTLWLLLFAFAGGKACQLIHRTRPQAEA